MALPFQDAFTRADAGTLGGNWTDGNTVWGIASNKARVTGGSGFAFNSSETYPQNHYAQCVLGTVETATDNGAGPAVRCTGAGDGYMAQCSTSEINLYKVVGGGSFTLLGTAAAASSGATVKLVASGGATTALEVFVNGASVISVNDSSSPLTTGNAAVWGSPSSTVPTVDDFEGGSGSGGGGGATPGAIWLIRA